MRESVSNEAWKALDIEPPAPFGRDATLKRIAVLDPNKPFEFEADVPKWAKQLTEKAQFQAGPTRARDGPQRARLVRSGSCTRYARNVYSLLVQHTGTVRYAAMNSGDVHVYHRTRRTDDRGCPQPDGEASR
jgi:hypothetical protein